MPGKIILVLLKNMKRVWNLTPISKTSVTSKHTKYLKKWKDPQSADFSASEGRPISCKRYVSLSPTPTERVPVWQTANCYEPTSWWWIRGRDYENGALPKGLGLEPPKRGKVKWYASSNRFICQAQPVQPSRFFPASMVSWYRPLRPAFVPL